MTIELTDGVAESSGNGFLLMQADENGVVQSVYVDADDIARLAAALSA